MRYHLDFSNQTKNDIDFHKKSGNKAILKKIFVLLNELIEHPYSGTGKPEPLKHDLNGKWSRRINIEHRLVYEVLEDKILIHSAKGHYN
ncbi:MAG: Txe/YoeB family addiction module toxin [Flavobacterium sp.]|uniref:Txe/YoeB family addiction module toxin n=1 Tax=Flavobacterium sp. TaxID=239 RepID=UPI002630A39E|nr:Txe/YoeB family addiction module toxin [Flavobacterium sp.]MDD5150896.1 Txe/YoeB family addiction module toxin [Flavobacterium sp.]